MATSKIAFDFNEPKAIETILYLANRISHSFKYRICKMVYLADKTSLEKYGRLIFGESYSAMKEGATRLKLITIKVSASCMSPYAGIPEPMPHSSPKA